MVRVEARRGAKSVTKLVPVGAVGQGVVAAEVVALIDRRKGSASAWMSRADPGQAIPTPTQHRPPRLPRDRRPPGRNRSLKIVPHAIPVIEATGVNAVAINAATVPIRSTRLSAMRPEQTPAANAALIEAVARRRIRAPSCQTPIAQLSVLRVRQIQRPKRKALRRARDVHGIVTDVIALPVLNAPNKANGPNRLFARPSLLKSHGGPISRWTAK